MRNSGKLLIVVMLAAGLAAAASSWWFRYAATNQAAKFWGPDAVRLIRDAPIVELYPWHPPSEAAAGGACGPFDSTDGRDLSEAPGLTHLRTALLEDQSFQWPAVPTKAVDWEWVLVFRDARRSRAAILLLSRDWKYVDSPEHEYILSCEPIADGLRELLEPRGGDDIDRPGR